MVLRVKQVNDGGGGDDCHSDDSGDDGGGNGAGCGDDEDIDSSYLLSHKPSYWLVLGPAEVLIWGPILTPQFPGVLPLSDSLELQPLGAALWPWHGRISRAVLLEVPFVTTAEQVQVFRGWVHLRLTPLLGISRPVPDESL